MHDGTVEEEGEVAYHLHEAGIVHKRVWLSFVTQGPGELTGQVAGLEEAEGDDEEENDENRWCRGILAPPCPRTFVPPKNLALDVGEEIERQQHVEQDEREPVAGLHG